MLGDHQDDIVSSSVAHIQADVEYRRHTSGPRPVFRHASSISGFRAQRGNFI
jgi:hypothetical protein